MPKKQWKQVYRDVCEGVQGHTRSCDGHMTACHTTSHAWMSACLMCPHTYIII